MSDNNNRTPDISSGGNNGNPAGSNSYDNANQNPADRDRTGKKAGRGRLASLLWVIIVLAIGAMVGLISYLAIAPHIVVLTPGPPFGDFGHLPDRGLLTVLAWHIILSTVSIALLVSLVVVYGRTYSQTRANFALGILIVLIALLLQQLFTYPVFQLILVGSTLLTRTPVYDFAADVFTIVAYSIFLYLSLE